LPEQFDVVVIGGGPGGYAAALYGASAGLSVALVEKDKVGGTCLHRGCIPAKELLETAHAFRAVSEAAQFGITTGEPSIDFGVAMQRKQQVVDAQWKGLQGTIKGRGVTSFSGTGRFVGGGTVVVDGTGADGAEESVTLSGANVILAAGSVVRTIPGFEIDGRYVLTFFFIVMMPTVP